MAFAIFFHIYDASAEAQKPHRGFKGKPTQYHNADTRIQARLDSPGLVAGLVNLLAIVGLRHSVGILDQYGGFVKKVEALGVHNFQVVLQEGLRKETIAHVLTMLLYISNIFQ